MPKILPDLAFPDLALPDSESAADVDIMDDGRSGGTDMDSDSAVGAAASCSMTTARASNAFVILFARWMYCPRIEDRLLGPFANLDASPWSKTNDD